MVEAGKTAFSADGLGCARCHGELAQGLRAPPLAGGRDVEDFRRVHQHGLFPRVGRDRHGLRRDQRLAAHARPVRAGRLSGVRFESDRGLVDMRDERSYGSSGRPRASDGVTPNSWR